MCFSLNCNWLPILHYCLRFQPTHPSDPSYLDTNQMDLIAKAVTLKSIKLSDPAAKKLLFSAKHSVLYSFDSHSSNWVTLTSRAKQRRAIYKLNMYIGKD